MLMPPTMPGMMHSSPRAAGPDVCHGSQQGSWHLPPWQTCGLQPHPSPRQHRPAAAGWAGTGVQSETQGHCTADAPGVGPRLRVDLPATAAGPVRALGGAPGHAAPPCRRTRPVQVSTAIFAEGWPLPQDAPPIAPFILQWGCVLWNTSGRGVRACWAVPDSCSQAFVLFSDGSLECPADF